MKLLQSASAGLVTLALAAAVAGCTTPASTGDDVANTSSDLRALEPGEILGEIHYGQDVSIAYTSTPRYRAYSFQGTKGDWLDVKVASSTGDVDAFLVDEAYQTVRRGTRAVLPKTGTYYLAVREGSLQPATITIDFELTVIHPGETPPADDAN